MRRRWFVAVVVVGERAQLEGSVAGQGVRADNDLMRRYRTIGDRRDVTTMALASPIVCWWKVKEGKKAPGAIWLALCLIWCGLLSSRVSRAHFSAAGKRLRVFIIRVFIIFINWYACYLSEIKNERRISRRRDYARLPKSVIRLMASNLHSRTYIR